MNTSCFIKLGSLAIDSGSVLDCVIYENLSYFPGGSVTFIDKMGLVQANFDFRSYVEIEITMGVFDDTKQVSTIKFNGDIVSSRIRSDSNDNSVKIIELSFIGRGDGGKLMASIPSAAYQGQSSISVIKDICKKKGVNLIVDSNVKTEDNMDWIIVHHNIITAMTFLCDRSKITDSALIYSINLKGDIILYSLKHSFQKKSTAAFLNTPPSSKNANYNNGEYKVNGLPVIYFNNANYENSTGVSAEASNVSIKTVTVDKNKVTSNVTSIKVGTDGVSDQPNTVIYQPGKSPQTHKEYDIAPIYRKAVIAKHSNLLDVDCESESCTSIGDVVDVVDGVYDKVTGKFKQVNKSSGKYIIMRKGYHYKQGSVNGASTMVTTIQLIANPNKPKDQNLEELRTKYGV